MLTLFSKHFDAVDATDIKEIVNKSWPESLTMEYKRELPSDFGKWAKYRKFDDETKKKVVKEVVALANTFGGFVIIGIDESGIAPHVARAINPIPLCGEIASRFEQIMLDIDQPIPFVQVRGIVTEVDGSSGIVIFNVPKSRALPHFSINGLCYSRNGTQSVQVKAREVRAMVLESSKREEIIELEFIKSKEKFLKWFPVGIQRLTGLRITSFPIGSEFMIDKLYEQRTSIVDWRNDITLCQNGTKLRLKTLLDFQRQGVIMRGVKFYGQNSDSYLDLNSNGRIDLSMRYSGTPSPNNDKKNNLKMHPAWIAHAIVNVMRMSDSLRRIAGVPDTEYAIEVSLHNLPEEESTSILPFVDIFENIGIFTGELQIPRVSYSKLDDASIVINSILIDLFDHCGEHAKFEYSVEPLLSTTI